MIRFLLDTSVLSALAPGRTPPAKANLEWGRDNQHRLFIPTVALLEIRQGVCKLERIGAERRAAALAVWFDGIQTEFADHIVDFDRRAAISAGTLADRLRAKGRHPGVADVMIGGMAVVGGFVVLSCNLKHFEPMGVPVFDPFSSDPALLPT